MINLHTEMTEKLRAVKCKGFVVNLGLFLQYM